MGCKILYGILYVVSLLPWWLLWLLSDVVSPVVWLCYRRKVVHSQLRESFPDKSEKEIRRIEWRFYRWMCDLVVEIVKQCSISEKDMKRHMVMKGLEPVERGFREGKTDMFCYLGHYGNWEWMASMQYWTPYCQCAQIYHPLYSDVMDKLFLKIRSLYGGDNIPMKKTARALVQYKNEGTKVLCGFIADQQPKWENIHHYVPFLNHDTAVFVGGEKMGKKFDTMAYYGRITRPRRGYYVCELVEIAHDMKSVPDYEVTDRYMQLLEEDIKAHPEIWLWTHKRWTRTKEEWERRAKLAVRS